MTIRNLHHAIEPKSLAVIGASSRQGSLGRVVIDNVRGMGFEGEIWPVNPKYSEVAGLRCYARVTDIPGVPDLAVIITPPHTIPGLIRDLGERGTRAAVVITAGLSKENGWRQAMLDAANPSFSASSAPTRWALSCRPRNSMRASCISSPRRATSLFSRSPVPSRRH